MTATNFQFADYKSTQKMVSGTVTYLNQVEPKRPLFLQKSYPAPRLINAKTINFDEQFGLRNVMGTFASPNADVNPVGLQNFGHLEMYFSYAKEFVTDGDDLNEDIGDERQYAGQAYNTNWQENYAYRLREKFMRAEQRFENLFELVASYNLLYGGYSSKSEYHPDITYLWQRDVITLASQLKGSAKEKLIPSVNLTTTAVTAPWNSSLTIMPVVATDGGVSYTAGEKAWTKANIDAGTATPYKDIVQMVNTCKEYGVADKIQISQDALEMLEYDIYTNYKEASDVNLLVVQSIQQKILPTLENIDGVQLERVLSISSGGPGNAGMTLPVFSNNSVYHDRTTGVKTSYIPNGFVSVIPTQASFAFAHGRIKHKKAGFRPQARWINSWMDEKSGIENWEWHTNFVKALMNPNSVVTWKVCG